MNRHLYHYTIAGILFTAIAGTLLHFAYEYSMENPLVAMFAPVNESTWEHMKLCFFPMLVYALFMNKQLKDDYPCVTSALLFGMLLGTFLIPIIFIKKYNPSDKTMELMEFSSNRMSILQIKVY